MNPASSRPPLECPDPVLRPGAQGIARVAVDAAATQLIVTFAHPLTIEEQGYATDPKRWMLTGGRRLFPHVLTVSLDNPPGTPAELVDRRVLLKLSQLGDFSVYTLTVSGPDVDPFFSSRRLRFRLDCDDPFDCRPGPTPAGRAPELPVVIDYLAKDYSGFRQALLDLVPTRLPGWTERSEADIGIMLLELLAAEADTLSYLQDRVAGEAYLETASQRRSVAGHLALVGYQLDEGASAWTFLQFQVSDTKTVPAGFAVSSAPAEPPPASLVGGVPAIQPTIVFETLVDLTVRPQADRIEVYDWGNAGCCLPAGSLSAALVGEIDWLTVGDWLLFDDGAGGRDVVRITAPPEIVPADPIRARPDGPITVIRWAATTPLHRDFCAPRTVARGNLVPATHGLTISKEEIRRLTADQAAAVRAEVAARRPGQRVPRQRLQLGQAPLAHLDPSTPGLARSSELDPAAAFTTTVPRSISTLSLEVEGYQRTWTERPTLLESGPDDRVFRVEIDDDGLASVVFGDDVFGLRPDETATVTATYRVGGGSVGNVAADTLTVARPAEPVPWLTSVTNPVPATGGRNPESRDRARRFGPATVQHPLVAVTEADYEAAATAFTLADGSRPIQRADASFRWTGSWLTVTLGVDPAGAETLAPALRAALLSYLDARRLAGYDLEVVPPVYVPLELAVEFCTRRGFRDVDVQEGIERVLSAGPLPGGGEGFFDPGHFSFGDPVYVSRLYAAITSIPGVESVQVTRLARQDAPHPDQETAANLAAGRLSVGPQQIVRLDNDRNFPENGVLTVRAKGASPR